MVMTYSTYKPEYLTSDDVITKILGTQKMFSDYANEIFLWCEESEINADLLGMWKEYNPDSVTGFLYFGAWTVPNEKERTFFRLKWS
jgi:hypothetical protein